MYRQKRLSASIRVMLAFTPLQYMLDTAAENPELVRIYTDNEREPGCCAVFLGHYLFAGGALSESFFRELCDSLTPDIRRSMEGMIVFYGEETVADLFRRSFEKVYDSERSLYRLVPPQESGEADAPDIVPIDWTLLQSGYENLAMITDEVLDTATYNGMDDFCRRGIGVAYVSGSRIYGFCTSEYPSQHAIAVGIGVSEEIRCRGIATGMAKAFMRRAADCNYTVFWDCWKKNEPSVKVALKCGFEKITDYPVLFVDLTA